MVDKIPYVAGNTVVVTFDNGTKIIGKLEPNEYGWPFIEIMPDVHLMVFKITGDFADGIKSVSKVLRLGEYDSFLEMVTEYDG